MNEKITTFLNSDLLERYTIGATTPAEAEKVEAYISKYPEVEDAYNTLQQNLEIVAKSNAVEAPKHILDNILEELDDKPVIALQSKPKQKFWYKYGVAASIAALVFAGSTIMFYINNQNLLRENNVIADEVFDLRSDIEKNNQLLSDIMYQFKQLNNPETQKYIITGNERAKNLKTVAYINPVEKTSMIDVVSLPQLPEEQCYQIWAEVQDKMVSLGILNETDSQLVPIPYAENALGLSITIEPKGGNKIASVDKSVAEISLKK
ncbi:anti-sigma factor domain-containing protein [Oceanihabitans sediminis]|uniref:RNA polymerase subunit sigma-70 n=1 Tax=Oceanihabitans sediminis TaxID=1812012 RepID=A0A368PC40_9FLAO|nr:anti-sigma factor [Oceanihabitans sediminis]MDX1278886.1 anti-sigma factor [Oceanihabitans sediminis]MDX1773835.1 anti-sigma factor [Oceanihabitans sediminis]RBP32141.1 anti-sigma-K factor rskA [Oceanihabitans sediminis]RCU58791.1 RNA polymerase subunit sigma-70 [Oceanihabitans sediminis]